MSEYAVLPLADYVDACEATREMTGGTERIPSGELAGKIRSIPKGENLDAELENQDVLIEDIMEALQGKAAGSGDAPVVRSLTVTENGTYNAPDGVDGYSPVVVDVPEKEPVTQELNVTQNGEYIPDSGVDGYSKVKVNVPDVPPVLDTLEVTENGTYNAPSNIDGYSSVVVDVPIPDVPDPVLQSKTVTPTTSKQTVKPDSGYDGLSQVEVNAMPTATQATPAVTVSESGLITAKATQSAGYVSAGTKSATKQLTTKGATTITPGASEQTAVSAGTFVTGDIKVAAVSGDSGGNGSGEDVVSVAFVSNWYVSVGNLNVPTSFAVFFRPGWTWGDYIASEFNKCPEILDGELTGNKGPVQAMKVDSSGGLISALPNASRWMLLEDYDSYEQVSAAGQIEANKIYYFG